MTMTGYRHKYVLSFDISKKYYSVNTEKISEHTVSSKGGDYRQKKNERLRFAVDYRLFLGDEKLVDIYILFRCLEHN